MKRLVILLVLIGGCSSVTIETPEGFKLTSTSFFLDRGIGEAKYGEAYIKGYNANANADAIRAAADGAAAGASRVAERVVP